jgi:hypothetical protein
LFIREEGTKRKKRRRKRKSEGRSLWPQTGNRVQGREGIIVETKAFGPFLGAAWLHCPFLCQTFPLPTHRSRKTKRREKLSC